MKKINLAVMLLSTTMVFSCAKDDSENNCSSAKVDAFNNISYSALTISQYSSESEILKVQAACNSYKATMGGDSCQALVNGSKTTINRSSRDEVCNKIDDILALMAQARSTPRSTPRTTTPPVVIVTPAPAEVIAPEDQQKLVTISDPLSALILDPATLTDRFAGEVLLIQGGKSLAFASLNFDMSKPYCYLLAVQSKTQDVVTSFNFDHYVLDSGGQSVTLSLSKADPSTDSVQITCWAGSNKKAADLNLSDLKKTFKGLLEFKVLTLDKIEKVAVE